MKVVLNNNEAADLFSEHQPSGGGFQSLIAKLQRQYDASNNELSLDADDLRRIPQYAFDYDQGGWEDQLIRIFTRTLGPNLGR